MSTTPDAGSGYAELRSQLATLTTEAFRPELADIDRLPTAEIAALMNREDRTVAEAVARRLPAIAAAIDATAARMARGGRLIYLGAGTAGRLGVLDASECPPTFNTAPGQVVGRIAGGPAALVEAVEGAEDSPDLAAADLDALGLTPDDTVVGISASGRTPYAVGAVEHARAAGALTIGLSGNADSPLAAAADHGIEIVTGPELLTGSTRLKAGTAQKLVLNMISTITMIRLGKTYGNLMVDVRASNDKLQARSRRIVALATGAPDEQIEAALAAADGEVKNAILMILADTDAPTAARRLAASGGRLREALQQDPRQDLQQNPPQTPRQDTVAADLAPTGVLRAAINLGNPVLAQGTPDAPAGITVDLAREIGARLGLPVELLCFDAARKSFEAMADGRADLCFLAVDPAREKEVAFTAPYVVIEGVYAVPRDSALTTVDDVDAPGVRIGVKRGSAYDLHLSRSLAHASVVRGDEGVDVFRTEGLEAGAGIRQPLTAYVAAHPDLRLIDRPFMEIRQAAGVPVGRAPETLAFLRSLVEELKENGFVADSLRRAGQDPALVAP